MRFFGKKFIVSMIGLFIQTLVFANNDIQISRYEQAKLRLSYEGSAGNLLQQLSQRLKVGFIAYDVDITRKVSIQNDTKIAIKTINEQIEKQLSDANVRFEKIGNRIFIIISAKGGEPLLKNTFEEQSVGDVVFEDDVVSSGKLTVEENPKVPSRLQSIFDIAMDKDRLAKVKGKNTPQYKIKTKEHLGLKNIRVTALGTFLIFDSKVDGTKLKVRGSFEDMAQGENIVAILHQNSEAPSKIEIENSEGKKLLLELHKQTESKTEKTKHKK